MTESRSTNASQTLALSGQPLTLEEIEAVADSRLAVAVAPDAYAPMRASRRVVDEVAAGHEAAYGINTGFGKLSDVRVGPQEVEALQRNLVRSHCCGVGEPLEEREVRAMLLLRANVLAKGCSGVRPELVEFLVSLLQAQLHPVVPARGSVGASGDLAPLAHLAICVLGEGDVNYGGSRMSASAALADAHMQPMQLQAKEGLALLNGTQAMCAVGGLALRRAIRVAHLADLAGAMSLEALRGTPTAFDARIHQARPHPGQLAAAAHLRELTENSEIRESHRIGDPRVQDAYCLRCMPQVHGAVRTALAHASSVLEIETGSATDNPLIFPDGSSDLQQQLLSGGNFHGAPLGLVLDYAGIAMTDLMSIGERRIDRLINPDINEGLPAFLSDRPGLSSGYMIAHVTAAALLNEGKVLSHPASVDSVPTSGGKEDHVSMGMTAALKFKRIVENAELSLAIELMTAAQGLDYRHPMRAATAVEAAHALVRSFVPRLTEDRPLSPDIERLAQAIRSGAFDAWR